MNFSTFFKNKTEQEEGLGFKRGLSFRVDDEHLEDCDHQVHATRREEMFA